MWDKRVITIRKLIGYRYTFKEMKMHINTRYQTKSKKIDIVFDVTET